MKKIALWAGLVCAPLAVSFAGEWFVATDGDDSNAGTREKPFATVNRARDAVRAAKAGGAVEAHTVRLGAGTFRVSETLLFNPLDSGTPEQPVVWRGADDGGTIVSGGVTVSGWRVSLSDSGVWEADIPLVDGRALYAEQLFVNGRRAARSRHPNSGFFHPKEVRQGVPIDGKDAKPAATEQAIVGADGDLDFLRNTPAEELRFTQFIIHHHWDVTKRIPLTFSAEENLLAMRGAPMKHWNPWRTTSLYYFENVRAGFDAAGEWFYDGVNGKILYRPLPGETLADSRFVMPRPGLVTLLSVSGDADGHPVHDLRFEKITFMHTDSTRHSQCEPEQAAVWTNAAVEVDHARNVVFADCEVTHSGEYGVWLKNARDCRVERCALTDLGAGGVRIGVTVSGSATGNIVDNCIIHSGGRLYACAVGVWLGKHTADNRVTRNDIGDFYYTGVSAGWTWGYEGGASLRNVIEFNRIHDLGQGAMADMGGVYTLGPSQGTRVCNNVIFSVASYSYGGWGLYTDEGSEGVLMENNLVYDTTDGSFHQHYGRDNIVRNNILAFSRPHQIAVTRVEPHRSLTFERNIIYWEQSAAIGYRAEQARVDYGSNLWWCADGQVDFKGKSHADWLALGKDVGGIVADPKFANAADRDFRLPEDTPAKRIGFEPFDFSRAGVYGNEAWVQRATKRK